MDLVHLMRNFAQEIGGQFSDYDTNKSIIVVPLEQGRFQTVIGRINENSGKRTMLEISSKICRFKESLDLAGLLKENANLVYTRFVILDDYLKIEAKTSAEPVSMDIVKEMIREVAEVADYWEQRLAGVDVK